MDEMRRKKGDEVEVRKNNPLLTSQTLFFNPTSIYNHQLPPTTTTGPPEGTSDATLHVGAAGGRDGAGEGIEVGSHPKPPFPTSYTSLKPQQPPSNQNTARGPQNN